jgi:hypothetical protein
MAHFLPAGRIQRQRRAADPRPMLIKTAQVCVAALCRRVEQGVFACAALNAMADAFR